MAMTDSPLRAAVRAVVPKPLRSTYWQLRHTLQTRQLMAGRYYERHVCAGLRQLIQPGMTCVDVGANVGLLTLFMAHHAGKTGQVFAFEPHPENVARLRGNVTRQGYEKRVAVKRAAVNDGSVDSITLYAGRGHATSEWNIVGHDADGHAAEAVLSVPAISLDTYFHAPQRIDVVKIDVEGAESQVLAGMQRIIHQWHPAMLIEVHDDANWRACTKLCDVGYELLSLHGDRLSPKDDYPVKHLIARQRQVHRLAG